MQVKQKHGCRSTNHGYEGCSLSTNIARYFDSCLRILMVFVLSLTLFNTQGMTSAFASDATQTQAEGSTNQAQKTANTDSTLADATAGAGQDAGSTSDSASGSATNQSANSAQSTLDVNTQSATAESGLLSPNATDTQEDNSLTAQQESALQISTLSAASSISTPTDQTDNLTQLAIKIAKLSYTDLGGTVHDIDPVTQDGVICYDFSSVPLTNIASMGMSVDFSVLKDDASRLIKPGDIFEYQIPDIFKTPDVTEPRTIASNGVDVATYTVVNGKATVTFVDTLNLDEGYKDIGGALTSNLSLNTDMLGEHATDPVIWTMQKGSTPYSIHAPGKAVSLSGITKTGTYNKDTSSATWKITVGSDASSAGVPLKGLTIADTYDTTQMNTPVVTDEQGQTLSVQSTGTGFSYTFPDDSDHVAPYTLTVQTSFSSDVLKNAADASQKIVNDATMTEPEGSSVDIKGTPSAEANVTVPKVGISKAGTALNSSTLEWSLTVNKDAQGSAQNVIVYDQLDAHASYVDASLRTKDGSTIPVYTSDPGTTPSGDYAVLDPATNLLAIHLAGVVNNQRDFIFDTSINLDAKDKNTEVQFPNQAWITYDYPGGSGPVPGSSVKPKPISITTSFQVAYIDKAVTDTDLQTGNITWDVKPSTRTDEYTTATITDVIQSDQTYVDGSVKVLYNGSELSAEELAKVFAYDANTQTMTLTLPKAAYDVNNVEIVYTSHATNFAKENYVNHTYKDTAQLDVYNESTDAHFKAEDSDQTVFKNKFLAKTSDYSVVDSESSSTGYLHYKVTVNANQMPCSDLHVSDNLSALTTYIMSPDGKSTYGVVDASKWTLANSGDQKIHITKIEYTDDSKTDTNETDVTSSFDTSAWVSNKHIDAAFGDTSAEYQIDMYLSLDPEVLSQYEQADNGDFIISADNTATATTPEYNGGTACPVTCKGSTGHGAIDNKLVHKSSLYSSDQSKGYVDYRVNINPNGSDLKSATIEDALDPALGCDLSSVTLYRAEHNSDGSIATAYDTSNPVDSSTWSKRLSYDAAQGKTILDVTLPDGTASYVLYYRTHIVNQTSESALVNQVSLFTPGGSEGSDTCTVKLAQNAWGWLKQASLFRFYKDDSSVGGNVRVPGAVYGLYSDAACEQLVSQAVSGSTGDALGRVTFYGLTPGSTYYYKEISSPDGYQLSTDVNSFVAGEHGEVKTPESDVTDGRTTSTTSVDLTKVFSGATASMTNAQASFKLKLHASSFDDGTTVPVMVTGSNGSYTLSTSESDEGRTDTLQTNAADGTLNIAGLPWGSYEIEEVEAPEGYTCLKDSKYFSVVAPTETTGWTVNYAPTGTSKDIGAAQTITDTKTVCSIEKTTVAGKSLAGAHLEIHAADQNGDCTDTIVTNPLTGQLFETTLGDSSDEMWDVSGLPTGSYWLRESTGPTDATLTTIHDVYFTVSDNGTITCDSASATVDGTTLHVVDNPAQLTVKKVDQSGKVLFTGTGIEATFAVAKCGANDSYTTIANGTWSAASLDEATSGHMFTGIERGCTYRISEVQAPAGYTEAPDFYVSVADDGSLSLVGSPVDVSLNGTTFTVSDATDGCSFTKIDDKGNPLAGATFSLTGTFVDGSLSKTFTSTDAAPADEASGLMNSELLVGNEYTLKEIAPPQGYEISFAPCVVELDGAGKLYVESAGVQTAVADNAYKVQDEKTGLTLSKQDESGTALSGARFTITGTFAGETKAETRDLMTSGSSVTMTGQLVAGSTYTISETQAPTGYIKDDDFQITMNTDGSVTLVGTPQQVTVSGSTVTVCDAQIPTTEIPDTPGTPTAANPSTPGSTTSETPTSTSPASESSASTSDATAGVATGDGMQWIVYTLVVSVLVAAFVLYRSMRKRREF
ncbi:MAG: hypothetical protein LKF61_05795 [Eggerthellaceae bacterium]|nr:hypothetical protein [Eggerthellaceae bacterium]